jgi:hypothetical protein
MTSKCSKLLALIFAIGLCQLSVAADTTVMGRLSTRDNKPVTVNSTKAATGTTILSGSQIVCPEKIGATVDLGSLGRLDIAPSTDVTLTFDGTRINVRLKAGYVILTTKKGIAGTVTLDDGKLFMTDSSKVSSVVAKTAGASGPEAAAIAGAKAGGIGAAQAAGIGGAAAAVIGGTAAAKSGRGRDLSSDNPRQP